MNIFLNYINEMFVAPFLGLSTIVQIIHLIIPVIIVKTWLICKKHKINFWTFPFVLLLLVGCDTEPKQYNFVVDRKMAFDIFAMSGHGEDLIMVDWENFKYCDCFPVVKEVSTDFHIH